MLPMVANSVAICKNRAASDEARERGSSSLIQARARHFGAKDIYVRDHANLTDDTMRPLADCTVTHNETR
jgi:hypothetical protein